MTDRNYKFHGWCETQDVAKFVQTLDGTDNHYSFSLKEILDELDNPDKESTCRRILKCRDLFAVAAATHPTTPRALPRSVEIINVETGELGDYYHATWAGYPAPQKVTPHTYRVI